ncbi:MAG: PIN domain-containing protein [Deferrisomatales bacterium]|nr:PIN domain-containing protein [Deferrisomatales bacterium]
MLGKLTSKNRLTLPKKITNAIGPAEYFDIEVRNGQIVLTPVRIQRADAPRAKLAELDLGEEDVAEVVAEFRWAWQRGAFRPLESWDTAAELVRVLACPKFRLSPAEKEVLLADYLPYAAPAEVPARGPTVPPCRDPLDVAFLLLAVEGRADFLVTGDQHLLALAGRLPCPIVTAEAFLQTLPCAGKDERTAGGA